MQCPDKAIEPRDTETAGLESLTVEQKDCMTSGDDERKNRHRSEAKATTTYPTPVVTVVFCADA